MMMPSQTLPKWIERKIYETLSRCSKNFERATYKGGRGALAPRPLFVGLLSHKLFRQLLKSRIFSFQSILACRGESENYILGTLDLL